MTWKNEIKKELKGNPVIRLNKIKHYVDGMLYIFTEGMEGKKVTNNSGEHEEYSDVAKLAASAIKQLEDFNEANMEEYDSKMYREQQEAGASFKYP